MKEIQVTVSYPMTFSILIDETAPIYDQQESIKDYANYLMETSVSDPTIEHCSEPGLIE